MPFKTFTAGEVLTASDVNTYLARQAVIVCTSGTRPASPVEGMTVYETDTDKLLTYDGATWNLPKNVSGGTLGYAQATANQTGITTEVDVSGLTTTVTVGAGRRIRVTAHTYPSTSVAGDAVAAYIKEGTTQLQIIDATLPTAARGETFEGSVPLTPTAGAHTYKVTMVRTAGTGSITNNAAATAPSFILVEDIGSA